VLQLPQERTKRTWRKSGTALPEHLKDTQRHRLEREAHNLFRKGYNATTHKRFRLVLESWMQGKTAQSSRLADLYYGILNQFPDEVPGTFEPFDSRRTFLTKFFSSEPDLKHDFENWLAAVRQSQG
jgi:hypothetical protein